MIRFRIFRIPNLTTMRILFSLLVFSLFGKSPAITFSIANQTDTTIVAHLLDGIVTEWPTEKFITDKATKIEYAVDNNIETLFLALNIPDQNVQKRIMQEGLNLYIDTKGKKKENRGIEFPVKMDNLASIEYMKLFGFGSGEPGMRSIRSEGTANIAIAWDSSFVMHIEYTIPLKMLEEKAAELNNKMISIGWKLEQSEMPVMNNQTAPSSPRVVTQVVSVPAGTRPSGNRIGPNANSSVSSINNNPGGQSTSGKAQSVWTSHTITF